MKKADRQSKIAELIENNEIETQEALLSLLKKNGVSAAQATVSRDLRELRVSKNSSNGKSVYCISKAQGAEEEKLRRVFNEGLVSLDTAGNLAIIKTSPGMASAMAKAIDDLQINENKGTIAGDDTIMCAAASSSGAEKIILKLRRMLSANNAQ